MNHIAPIGFLDTWAFSAALHNRHKDKFGGDHHSAMLLPLRGPQGPLPVLAEWRSAKALLSRIRLMASTFMGGKAPVLGEAAVVQLRPHGFVEWSLDPEAPPAFHLCIVPSPDAYLYAGGICAVLPVGQLTYLNRRVLWSAVNFGPSPVIHLVVDVKAPDDADE